MSRWTAEILFFAGRSTFRAQKVHGKSASHQVHLPKASEFFSRKIKNFNFSSFFIKVQRKIVFCHGRGKFLDNFIWDFVSKETASFRASSISWILFRTPFDPWWRLHFTVAGTMSRWTAEILFFAGRSTFRAEKVHGKSASHQNRQEAFRRPPTAPGAFQRLSEAFSRTIKKPIFHHFAWKFKIKSFFVMGEAKMLTTLSDTSSGKRRLNFEPEVSRGLN